MRTPAATATSAQRNGTRAGTKSRIARLAVRSATKGDGPRREAGGRVDRVAVVEQAVEGQARGGRPVGGEGRVVGELPVGGLPLGVFELTEGVIQQVVRFHRINRSHLVGTSGPSPGAWPGRRGVST